MATYKRRGYKKQQTGSKSKLEQESLVAKSLEGADDIAVKSERFFEKHEKKIYAVVGALALLLIGYYYYYNKVVIPKRQEAANEMYMAQSLFEKALNEQDLAKQKDLFQQSLKGSAGKYGFLDIIDEYGGTPSGELAHYYAGAAYFHLGQYDKAVSELSKYKRHDDVLYPMALGLIGESFLQLNQEKDALDYFVKAAKATKNTFVSPLYYMKAGETALALYKSTKDESYLKKAKSYFKKIVEDYPSSQFKKDAEVYLAQAEYAR